MELLSGISLRTKIILFLLAAVLLTTFAITLFSFKASEANVKAQNEELTIAYLNLAIARFDLVMENIHRSAVALSLNQDLVRMLSRPTRESYEDYYELVSALNLIQTFSNTSRYVRGIKIYNFMDSTVISSDGSRTGIDEDAEEYKIAAKLSLREGNTERVLFRWVDDYEANVGGVIERQLLFFMPFDSEGSVSLGCIVIGVPEERIAGLLQEHETRGDLYLIRGGDATVVAAEHKESIGRSLSDFVPQGTGGSVWAGEKVADSTAYLVAGGPSQHNAWHVLLVTPMRAVLRENIRILKSTIVILAIITAFLSSVFLLITNLLVYRPVSLLLEQVRSHGLESPAMKRLAQRRDEIGFLFRTFREMTTRNQRLMRDVFEQQLRLRDSQIKLLRSQINPHFLYNSLDAIIWLSEFGEHEKIPKMVRALVRYFRLSIRPGRDMVGVHELREQLESYLTVQSMRYGERLEAEINFAPEISDRSMPGLLIQPLVENSIHHGIERKTGPGRIRITGRLEGEDMVFAVEDDGVGMTRETLDALGEQIRADHEESGSFSALRNIDRRVKAIYGNEYGLSISSEEGRGTCVTVRIPVTT